MIYQVSPRFGQDYYVWADAHFYQHKHPRKPYPLPRELYESLPDLLKDYHHTEPRIKLHTYQGRKTPTSHLQKFHAYELPISVILADVPKFYGRNYVWLDFQWIKERFTLWEVSLARAAYDNLLGYEVRLR